MTLSEFWPFIFIAVAGFLGTDLWRWLGVIAGKRLDESSELLSWVKATATALVAGVIAKQILYPGGVLAASSMSLRIGAAVGGFAVFLLLGRRMLAGILAALVILGTGLYFAGF